jgi:hypothetical protein
MGPGVRGPVQPLQLALCNASSFYEALAESLSWDVWAVLLIVQIRGSKQDRMRSRGGGVE